MKKHKPVNMEYFKYLKADSLLGTKDLQEIFHFKKPGAVGNLERLGTIPKHDLKLPIQTKTKTGAVISGYYWYAKNILEFIKHEKETK